MNEFTPFDYEPIVRKGMKFLDEHGPSDWRNRISWANLDIYSTEWCIAGQVFADELTEDDWPTNGYDFAIEKLSAVYPDEDIWIDQEYGFNTHDEDNSMNPRNNLESTWKRLVTQS